jgi:hypothetical protein
MAARAAVGFRAHSGWAAAVAVAGPVDAPAAIVRRRIEMVDRGVPGAAQPYHAAAGLNPRDAERIVTNCAARAALLAQRALAAMVEELQDAGYAVTGCGLLLASGRPLPALESILASHPLIHTAEGELFREALRAASRECGLPMAEVKERELFERGTAELGIAAAAMQQRLSEMGRAMGAPWRQDEKYAAMVGWLALAGEIR